jgi:hypothetical protein
MTTRNFAKIIPGSYAIVHLKCPVSKNGKNSDFSNGTTETHHTFTGKLILNVGIIKK